MISQEMILHFLYYALSTLSVLSQTVVFSVWNEAVFMLFSE